MNKPTRVDTRRNLLMAGLGAIASYTALTTTDIEVRPNITENQIAPGVVERISELDHRPIGTFLPLLITGMVSAAWGTTALIRGRDTTVENIVADVLSFAGKGKAVIEHYVPATGQIMHRVTEISTSWSDAKRSLQILAQASKSKRLTLIATTDSGKTFTMLLLLWLRNGQEQRGNCAALPYYICDIKFGEPDRNNPDIKLTWGDYHKVNPHGVKKRAADIRSFLNTFIPTVDSSAGLVILPELSNVQTLEEAEEKTIGEKLPGLSIADCVNLILKLGDSYGKGIWTDDQSDLVGGKGSDTRTVKSNEFIILGQFTYDIAVLRNTVGKGRNMQPEEVARVCRGLSQSGHRPFVYLDRNGGCQVGAVPFMPEILERKWAIRDINSNPYDNQDARKEIREFIERQGRFDCKTKCALEFGLSDRNSTEYKEQFSPVFKSIVEELKNESNG